MRLQSTSIRRALSSPVIIGILAIMFILVSALALNIGGGGQSSAVRESELFDVTRGNFEIRVPTSGELEAQEQINSLSVRSDKRQTDSFSGLLSCL